MLHRVRICHQLQVEIGPQIVSLKTLHPAVGGHALRDEAAVRWLRWLSMGLGAAQALAAYTTATALAGKMLSVYKDA